MSILEKDIEKRLVREVKKLGGLCLKWVSPGNSGVPDRIVLMPGGKAIFVELKRPGGKEGALQRYWKATLETLGFGCYTIYDYTEMQGILGELAKMKQED